MATATKKPAAKKTKAPEAPDASYPAQKVEYSVDPDTGNATVKIDGIFDREAARALAKTCARIAAEVA